MPPLPGFVFQSYLQWNSTSHLAPELRQTRATKASRQAAADAGIGMVRPERLRAGLGRRYKRKSIHWQQFENSGDTPSLPQGASG